MNKREKSKTEREREREREGGREKQGCGVSQQFLAWL